MPWTIKKNSIFNSGAEYLVNPVNTVGVMGAGLAAEFKWRYPFNFQAYSKLCQRQLLRLGEPFFYATGLKGEGEPRWIVNFPTKRHWRDRSQLIYITLGVRHMLEVSKHYYKSGQRFAIPALGCGLGGLQWEDVWREIQKMEEDYPHILLEAYIPESYNFES